MVWLPIFFWKYLGYYAIVELLACIKILIFIHYRDDCYTTEALTTTDFFINTFSNQQPSILYYCHLGKRNVVSSFHYTYVYCQKGFDKLSKLFLCLFTFLPKSILKKNSLLILRIQSFILKFWFYNFQLSEFIP